MLGTLSALGLGHISGINSQRKSTARKKYTLGFAPPDGRPHERPKPRKRKRRR
jgi:hypothetical protein